MSHFPWPCIAPAGICCLTPQHWLGHHSTLSLSSRCEPVVQPGAPWLRMLVSLMLTFITPSSFSSRQARPCCFPLSWMLKEATYGAALRHTALCNLLYVHFNHWNPRVLHIWLCFPLLTAQRRDSVSRQTGWKSETIWFFKVGICRVLFEDSAEKNLRLFKQRTECKKWIISTHTHKQCSAETRSRRSATAETCTHRPSSTNDADYGELWSGWVTVQASVLSTYYFFMLPASKCWCSRRSPGGCGKELQQREQFISSKHMGPDVCVKSEGAGRGFNCGEGPMAGAEMLNLSPWQHDISPSDVS